MEIIKKIKKQIKENKIIIYMKGCPKEPKCGFSAQAIKIIYNYTNDISYIDILNNQEIRSNLYKISNWPTYPQIWINGKFIGGCDDILELHHKGKLKSLLENK